MDFGSIDTELISKLLLLLLIGLGPEIALVPFLDKTKRMSPEEQRATGRLMVKTAVVTALVIFASGALLMRLLHITSGAVAVARRNHSCPSRDQDGVGSRRRHGRGEPFDPGRWAHCHLSAWPFPTCLTRLASPF